MVGKTESASSQRPSSSSNPIGQRLRQLRRGQNLTLRALAQQVGVTGSLISQIETGQVNPSVDTLYGLAGALGVPATCFFETAEQHARHGTRGENTVNDFVVHPDDRRCIELANGVTWHSLLPTERSDLEFCEVCYPPGSVSAPTMEQHTGYHCLVVLEGTLTVQLSFMDYRLVAGDSIAFQATSPHQLRNEGPKPVRAVLVLMQRAPSASPANPTTSS
jgi:transcriptional regulator with XRE-family HTH domain